MTSDQMYQIYEEFTEQVTTHCWKGKRVSWTETIECRKGEGMWHFFEVENGFCLAFAEYSEDGKDKTSLECWVDDGTDTPAVSVESLEQLLKFMN